MHFLGSPYCPREETPLSAQWLAMAEPSALPLGERLKQLRKERKWS